MKSKKAEIPRNVIKQTGVCRKKDCGVKSSIPEDDLPRKSTRSDLELLACKEVYKEDIKPMKDTDLRKSGKFST